MKDIKGYEGLYAITRDGRVWSYPKKKASGYMSIGCFLKPRGSGRKYLKKLLDCKRDYRRYSLTKLGITKDFYIHRLVAQTFIDNPLNLREVNHINGIKYDNRVENLEWVTKEQNAKHAVENGLTARGDKNHSTKLNENQVREIRKLYIPNKKGSARSLSEKYNISMASIHLIYSRKNWKWLD